jgi:peptidoglycan/LPS O-acetylase OafA/YrhL
MESRVLTYAGGRSGLSPRLRASLNAARAVSAIYVTVRHVSKAYYPASPLGFFFSFGQEAVIVFFLLSGFVIFANEHRRAIHPWGYYIRRLRRIYPPLLFTMLVSTLVALDNGTLAREFHWTDFWGTLLSLQDDSGVKPGNYFDAYLGNASLWSLSYEVAFYAVFPLLLRCWLWHPRLTNHFVGAASCLALTAFAMAPNHWALVAAYFLVWWCGAMAARSYLDGGNSCANIGSPLIWLFGLIAIALSIVLIVGYSRAGFYPFLLLRHFGGALFALCLLYGPMGRLAANVLARYGKAWAALASISYGLYILHFPILINWNRAEVGLGLLPAVLVLIGLSWVAEQGLDIWLPKAPSD